MTPIKPEKTKILSPGSCMSLLPRRNHPCGTGIEWMSLVPSCAFLPKLWIMMTILWIMMTVMMPVMSKKRRRHRCCCCRYCTQPSVCVWTTCGLFICGDLVVWDETDDNISFECWSSINKKSRMPRDPVNTLVKHDNNISAFCVKELEENTFFCENPSN